jgi:hypothetical protein
VFDNQVIGVSFRNYNGYVYGVVWRFEVRNCQTATMNIRCNALQISTIRQMHYTRCYAPLFQLIQPLQLLTIAKIIIINTLTIR